MWTRLRLRSKITTMPMIMKTLTYYVQCLHRVTTASAVVHCPPNRPSNHHQNRPPNHPADRPTDHQAKKNRIKRNSDQPNMKAYRKFGLNWYFAVRICVKISKNWWENANGAVFNPSYLLIDKNTNKLMFCCYKAWVKIVVLSPLQTLLIL